MLFEARAGSAHLARVRAPSAHSTAGAAATYAKGPGPMFESGPINCIGDTGLEPVGDQLGDTVCGLPKQALNCGQGTQYRVTVADTSSHNYPLDSPRFPT